LGLAQAIGILEKPGENLKKMRKWIRKLAEGTFTRENLKGRVRSTCAKKQGHSSIKGELQGREKERSTECRDPDRDNVTKRAKMNTEARDYGGVVAARGKGSRRDVGARSGIGTEAPCGGGGRNRGRAETKGRKVLQKGGTLSRIKCIAEKAKEQNGFSNSLWGGGVEEKIVANIWSLTRGRMKGNRGRSSQTPGKGKIRRGKTRMAKHFALGISKGHQTSSLPLRHGAPK